MKQVNDTNAFAETLFIINCLPDKEQSKIPKKFIEFLKENKNNDYVININPNIGLENQKLLDETMELLKEIYISYFISAEEKNKILQNEKYSRIIEEDLKKQKYSTDKIFSNTQKVKNSNDELLEKSLNNGLIKYKESFFTKFKNFIFRILHIDNSL